MFVTSKPEFLFLNVRIRHRCTCELAFYSLWTKIAALFQTCSQWHDFDKKQRCKTSFDGSVLCLRWYPVQSSYANKLLHLIEASHKRNVTQLCPAGWRRLPLFIFDTFAVANSGALVEAGPRLTGKLLSAFPTRMNSKLQMYVCEYSR